MYSTSRTSVARSDASARSSTDTFGASSPAGEHGWERKPMKREEMEVRRYTGKDSIEDYLQQFDLAARHNYWTDSEKASYLLCALDGSARGILSEIEDVFTASYKEVRGALLKRFGPIDLPAAHEQALHQLRLAPGQHIRELAQEVQRLTQRAFIDLAGRARNQVMIGFFLRAIPDKDVVFYIRDKDPRDLGEACYLYERFRALSGAADQRPSTVRATSCEEKLEPPLKASDRRPTSVWQGFLNRIDRRSDQIDNISERASVTSLRVSPNSARSTAPRIPYRRYGQMSDVRYCDGRWKEEPSPMLPVHPSATSPMLPVHPVAGLPKLPVNSSATSPMLPVQPAAATPLLPEQSAVASSLLPEQSAVASLLLPEQSAAASLLLPEPAVASSLLPKQPTAESPLLPEQPTAESPLLPEQPTAESPLLPEQPTAESPLLPEQPTAESPLLPEQPTAESPLLPEQPTAESPLLPEQPTAESPLLPELSSSDEAKLQRIDIDAAGSICGATSDVIKASTPAQKRVPAVYVQTRVNRTMRAEPGERESCLWSSVRSVWSTPTIRESILPVRLFYGHLPRPPENRKYSTVPEERGGFAAGGASFPSPLDVGGCRKCCSHNAHWCPLASALESLRGFSVGVGSDS